MHENVDTKAESCSGVTLLSFFNKLPKKDHDNGPRQRESPSAVASMSGLSGSNETPKAWYKKGESWRLKT